MRTYKDILESNDAMKSTILKAYNDSGKDKKKFISLALKYTGLTRAGMNKDKTFQDFLDTLVFK
jgi:hypothetical protein